MSCKIKFTGYKTNQRDYYDSYADFDLVTALVRSFYDSDMQQWQGFVDAVNELTTVNDWTLDFNNGQIKYEVAPDGVDPVYYYKSSDTQIEYQNMNDLCAADFKTHFPADGFSLGGCRRHPSNPGLVQVLAAYNGSIVNNYVVGWYLQRTEPVDKEEKTINFITLAQKIISDMSSSNAGIQLHAENYINAVVNSIFETDPNKQFIKIDDLYEQLEQNKIIRI